MISLARPRLRIGRTFVGALRIRVGGDAVAARPELRVYAQERTRSALDHLERRVECMAVTVSSSGTGPERDSIRCQVWARLKSGRQLREECRATDPYAAIDAAAEAAARGVEYLESRLPLPSVYAARGPEELSGGREPGE